MTNNVMKTLHLYSTPGCHLCELAKDIVWPLLNDYPFAMQEIDIVDSDELLERYGVRIPVLALSDTGDELGWPFDSVQANAFLQHCMRAIV